MHFKRLAMRLVALSLALLLPFDPVLSQAQSFTPSSIGSDAATIFRDYNTDGISTTGAYNPQKSQIRQWGGVIGGAISQLFSTGGAGSVGFTTQAALYANLAYPANTIATVFGDGTAAKNGIYIKVGASGVGSWSQITTTTWGLLPAWSVSLTLLPSGSTPYATVAGTISAPILNLFIPQGVGANVSYYGTWSSATAYPVNSVVSYSGAVYIATAASTNVVPTNTSYWGLLIPSLGAGAAALNLANQTTTVYSAAHTITAADCGNTVIMSSGTSGMLTVSFPLTVTGFPPACEIDVANGDTVHWQVVSNVANLNWLYPMAVAGPTKFRLMAGSWYAVDPHPRYRPSANPTFYIDQTNGNDANDCQSTGTGACATFQGAFTLACTSLDAGPYITTLQAASSQTYTASLTISGGATDTPSPACVGISNMIVDGGGSTISVAGIPIYLRYAPFAVALRNIALTSSAADDISVRGAGFVSLEQGVVIGPSSPSFPQILVYGSGQLATCPVSACPSNTGLTISGGGQNFIQALEGGHAQFEGVNIAISGTPTYTQGFIGGTDNSGVSFHGTTFSGTNIVGDQFSISKGMYLDISAQTGSFSNCANTYLPGSTCGQVYSGARVSEMGIPTVSGCGTSAVVQNNEPDFLIILGSGLPSTAATYVNTCVVTFATRSKYGSCSAHSNDPSVPAINEAFGGPGTSANGTLGLSWTANGSSPTGKAIYVGCKN